ncbi:MAG: hypothetical protein FJ403_19260 [Verrucomicrobia bacterium]|nr:hypothetical protein [Verrucomicrobiota bacterium]
MAKRAIVALGFCVIAAAIAFAIYKKRAATGPPVDPSFHHTAEGVNFKIQEQRTLLADAVKNRDLEFVHNQMYYVQTLGDALSAKLTGDKKQQIDVLIRELKRAAEEIDNWAGRGNQAAAEAGFQKLSRTIDELNAHFKVEVPKRQK